MKEAVIFDMDGVLVNSMPFHYKAMSIALKEITNIDLDKKTFYLLEGMPVAEMALEILRLNGYRINKCDLQCIGEKIAQRKKTIFKKMNVIPKSYDKVKELINNDLNNCLKAIVSGSSKNEVEMIVDKNFGKDKFNVIINGDDFEGRGKPDPAPFKSAINKLNIKYSSNNIIIVENAPLGIMAANAANIPSIVILNNSPLDALDFAGLISKDKIFKDIKSARDYLVNWYYYHN
ncbi:MAG TPA: HAD family phosphatase [Nitrososphaeraceae archaeon]|nr:HAD family phosphatase [Nitrososphaeraceae archaeon]